MKLKSATELGRFLHEIGVVGKPFTPEILRRSRVEVTPPITVWHSFTGRSTEDGVNVYINQATRFAKLTLERKLREAGFILEYTHIYGETVVGVRVKYFEQ
tara:strand:+ start:51 stop:353 length:303 start_codon:yes stop_codon:yes gene_type:complete